MNYNSYTIPQLHAIYCVYRDLDPATRTVQCCTCGKVLHIEQVEDCYAYYGHFIARSTEPKLKYSPINAFPQCIQCNVSCTKTIDDKYKEYIQYRFGDIDSYISKMYSEADKFVYDEDFYVHELIKLADKFPELISVIDQTYVKAKNNSSVEKDNSDEAEKSISEQWNTYSNTYKSDLDTLTKILGTEPIEYERL